MKAQFENKAMSSFLLYVDNKILTKGEAYTNISGGSLYPVSNKYDSIYTYAAPYKQLVADTSVSGVEVASGIHQDGVFYSTGVAADLYSVNHYEGQWYFTADKSSYALTANYSVKDFNVYLSSKSEEELLFETKFHTRPKTPQTLTGLEPEQQTFPAIFIRNNGGKNDPAFFGGMDNTIMNIRSVVLADSAFSLDAICGILKDSVRTNVPLIEQSSLSFDSVGGSESGYNYAALKSTADENLFIKDVFVSKDPARGLHNTVNPSVFPAFIDFTLEIFRYPRS